MTLRPLGEPQRKLLAEAVFEWHKALMHDPQAQAVEYLKGRGVSHASAVAHRLGFAGPETTIPGLEKFTNHIILPYLAIDGHAMGFKARSLDPEAKKRYDQPVGQVQRLFNVRALDQAVDLLVITEGEFDAIILDQLGLPTIAVGGNTAITTKPHFARILEGFRRVVLFKDRDANEAGDKLERDLRKHAPNIPLVAMYPPGWSEESTKWDVTDSVLAGHAQEIVGMATDGTH